MGLWHKTFNVKRKVVRGNQAECGGAMVGKMANVLWLKTFNVKTKVVRGNQAECGGAMVGKMANVL